MKIENREPAWRRWLNGAKDKPTDLLFRGVMFMLMSLTFNAITITKDEDEAVAKAKFDFGNLLDFLVHARDDVAKFVSVP